MDEKDGYWKGTDMKNILNHQTEEEIGDCNGRPDRKARKMRGKPGGWGEVRTGVLHHHR
jgi:hypothetical protein